MIEINIEVIAYIATIIFMALGLFGGVRFSMAKTQIRSIRLLFDEVDDALYDNEVSEDEFRIIFNRLKTIIRK